jgi:TM2 domain-containing membrane protein YozV
MHCTNCGQVVAEGARFCVDCGTALAAASSQALVMAGPAAIAQTRLPPLPPPLPALATSGVQGRRQPAARIYAEGKTPAVALILSLIIVGLGQFYNGDIKKGFLMLGGAIVGGLLSFTLLWWVFSLWSAIDAYRVAKRSVPLWT